MRGGGVIGRNIAVRLGMANVPGVAINRHWSPQSHPDAPAFLPSISL
jgi:hypothetical protein